MAAHVSAYAPVIGQIPSPIVGNKHGTATQAQPFTFPDAFDIHALATDDNIASDDLIWTYEISGQPKYSINGDEPVNSLTENVIRPSAAKRINVQWNGMSSADAADDPNPDGKTNTLTIRNIELYPYGGTSSTDQSREAQDCNRHAQPVTFWCSDGEQATSATVMFYTDNTYTLGQPTGWNRLSNPILWRGIGPFDPVQWTTCDPLQGNITTGTWTDGRGICFIAGKEGNNWGSIGTGMLIPLIDNTVYRIRLVMNCDQLSTGKTPLWDFILENWNGDPRQSLNLYGMDTFFMDNEGGANAVVQRALGTEFTMIWAPPAFQTDQWRNTTDGIFAMNPAPPAGNGIDYSLVRDARLRFRVMDLDARADLQNNQKFGAICMQYCIVEACPVAWKVYTTGPQAMEPTPDLYSATSFKGVHNVPSDPVPGNVLASGLTGSSINFAGGVMTITPVGAARANEIVQVTPATDTKYEWGNWPTIADDWPIPWQFNKIYELKVELSAPNDADAAHPFDVFWMNMEPATNEVITESYVTGTHAIATPRKGAPQPYTMFYYSGNETRSAFPALHFLRWRLRFGNSDNLDWPNLSDQENTGAVRVHSVRVNQVAFW